FFYKNGISIQQDLRKAFYWYQQAANNGNKIAQFNLGNFYRFGSGIDKNEGKALEWYKELAGHNNKIIIGNNELIESMDEIVEEIHINTNDYPFNRIQLNKPTVNISTENSNIWNDTYYDVNVEFISIKSTISFGIDATSYIEVEKLQKLLISRKDDIDHVLESQPVYAIGIDFQEDSSRPCIACWVVRPL
ncbi:16443_t:CDS:2, partial [Funneliformis geosporum]